MFHVMLVLPALAVFGVMAGVVLSMMMGLLGVVFFFELLVHLFFKSLRWLFWLPVVIAALGIGACLYLTLPMSFIMLYFGLYGACALCGVAAAFILRKIYRMIVK